MSIPPEHCVALLRDALSNRPTDPWSDDAAAWFAHIVGVISAYNPGIGMTYQLMIPRVGGTHAASESSISANMTLDAQNEFVTRARSLLTQLQLSTNMFTTLQFPAGAVFDYFEGIRELLSGATSDVFFVDPHIDGVFVNRYLPQIPAGITVRLLTTSGRATAVRQALDLYEQQHGMAAQLRAVPNQRIHERHLVIDRRDVYLSGASFKDGAALAAASIVQITDIAPDLIRAHETTWSSARVI